MCNREFIQRTHRACYKQHDVARPDEHHVSTFQPKTRVDQRVAGIERQLVKIDVLAFITAGRYPDVKTTRIVRGLSDNVNNPGRRAGQ